MMLLLLQGLSHHHLLRVIGVRLLLLLLLLLRLLRHRLHRHVHCIWHGGIRIPLHKLLLLLLLLMRESCRCGL